VAPEFTFALARPLTVSLGLSFEHLDSETRTEPDRQANAVTGEVRYGHKIEGDVFQQSINGRYNFRAGMRGLGSDYSYSRHMVSLRYEIRFGRQTASDELMGGSVAGQAPFFERFVLGSDSTLRGWDRYAIDPFGGDRMVHNSLTYGYQFGDSTAETFYDCGALWNAGGGNAGGGNAGRAAQLRHSLGVGFRRGIFVLTMAFPVEGRIEPVFMAGMNY
jgi:outer membrane protein assembly factor BamA